MSEIEIKGFEEFIDNGVKRKRVVFKLRGVKTLKDLEIDAYRDYSTEELIQLIKSQLEGGG